MAYYVNQSCAYDGLLADHIKTDKNYTLDCAVVHCADRLYNKDGGKKVEKKKNDGVVLQDRTSGVGDRMGGQATRLFG